MSGGSDPVRLVAVTPKALRGGAERWLEAVLVNSDRIDPLMVVLDEGWLAERMAELGVPVRTVPTGRSIRQLVGALGRTGAILREVDAEVVLLNGTKPGIVALPWAWLKGRRTIYVKHGAQHDRSLSPALARLADHCVAVSDDQAAMLPAGRTTIVMPPRPALAPAGPPRPDHRPLRLVMLCRLFPSKGVDTAIAALGESPAWELVVAGPEDAAAPGERDRLLAVAEEHGVTDRVHLIGEVDDPAALLQTADAAAMLSRPWGPAGQSSEGFGLVVVEAAAGGVPVVADPSRIPSARAMHQSGVEPVVGDDIPSLRDALRRLEDPDLRARLGAAGRAGVVRLPDAVQTADRLADVAATLCLRPGAGRSGGPPMSVIVPLLNEIETVDDLVEALLPQLHGDDESADELILVDNGSTDGTWEHIQDAAARDARVRVLRSGGGTSRARNDGARAARHQWLTFTDAGCRPASGWLESFRAAAGTGDFDLLTGLSVVASDGRAWQDASVLATYPTIAETQQPDVMVRAYRRIFGLGVSAFAPGGRSVAVSRRLHEAVGGFPEDMITAEDVEFGMRVRDAGGRAALVAGAAVEWDQRTTLAATWRMFRRYGEGDGQSGRWTLIGRSFSRAAAYGVGPVLVARGGPLRWLVLTGAGMYFSLPARRALAARPRPAVLAMMPVMMAVKDLGKAAGCTRGLWAKARGRRQVS